MVGTSILGSWNSHWYGTMIPKWFSYGFSYVEPPGGSTTNQRFFSIKTRWCQEPWGKWNITGNVVYCCVFVLQQPPKRIDENEDRDDSPDVESSSVSSASSWNSTDEQMRKTLMKSEMVPVMLTIGSSSGRRTNARGSCWEGTPGDKPTWLSMGHQLARFGAVDESMVQWIYEPTYNLVMNH